MIGLMLLLPSGCSFSERSIPWQPHQYVDISFDIPPTSTRQWLIDAQHQLEHLLPDDPSDPLLTDDLMTACGASTDVRAHFKIQGRNLRRLLHNWSGFKHSAQGVGSDQPKDDHIDPWAGYESVQIPVNDHVMLSGMLGMARDSHNAVMNRDCIVLLPGLFGNNNIFRTQDLAHALMARGFHVLALELRGHGQTELHHPDVPYTFGVNEIVDLMHVSEWLESMQYVRQTGLIGFCWGGNIGLLTAWYDGHAPSDISISDNIAQRLPPISNGRHFSAGIMAFSVMYRFEDLIEEMETRKSYFSDPILSTVQNTVRTRMEEKSYLNPNHSLRQLIIYENMRSRFAYPGGVADWYRFLRLIPHNGLPDGDKLQSAEVPVLIVHAANDPLCPAQDVADLMARVTNPNVAAIILPGGGHVGFAPYADGYYFNLILNFFNPQSGAATTIQ